MKQHSEKNIDDLRWIRVFTSMHVPKYLVEQVRDRDYSVDDFYTHQDANLLMTVHGQPQLNPFHHLYVLVEPGNLVKGFLWFVIDPLTKDIAINTFSMDKEYWGRGKAVEMLANHVKEIRKKAKLKKVYWITNYPKHSERYQFKRSKSVLMEYTEVDDGKNIDGWNNERTGHRSLDSGTAGLPE